jgi:adenylate kinase
LLAQKLGLIHFDTGRFIESVVHDPANIDDPETSKHRISFDTGKLVDPMWVYASVVKKNVANIHGLGMGIVFSGSPRTELEAFTADGNTGLVHFLETLYGREAISIVLLNIRAEVVVDRNSHRLICSVCGLPVRHNKDRPVTACPVCGGPLRKRTLDTAETMQVRLEEYRNRTEPILTGLRARGYTIHAVNGEPLPYLVFAEILQSLKTG